MDVEDAAHFAGVPDEFQRLWTPHRMVYIQQGQQSPHSDECPFCAAPTMTDEQALIVHRGTHAYALLNLFPYNSGHLLVCPYRHVSLYDDATPEETDEIATITQTAMRVIRSVARNDGYNIGMNQGEIAGAGIASHLHQHVVPRWRADANFLPIIAHTKAVPQLLGEMRQSIADAWPR
ncbi:HIT family protein [Humibacter ginsenosidimutans]|uniref:HIT domain-containing protein n=1 Tax=Humibacter ginsenosidimutans TaxID=2599293 RepID=A0A5B8M2A6_9MICO|nr:HIT domain-containing protein [Humibacter ginsenosidimutans]QDZ13862.1 HIT domain-containing protein [Humibacter ginsenosidimutans]